MYSNIPLSHLTLNDLFSLKWLLSYRWMWFLKIQFLGTSPQILEKERSEFLILDRSAAPYLIFFIVCCSNLFQFFQSDFFLLSCFSSAGLNITTAVSTSLWGQCVYLYREIGLWRYEDCRILLDSDSVINVCWLTQKRLLGTIYDRNDIFSYTLV